jgi:hypothetical protein
MSQYCYLHELKAFGKDTAVNYFQIMLQQYPERTEEKFRNLKEAS